jgi:hypothetical protein
VAGDALNPQGRSGVSWFVDTFEFPLFVVSFLICAAAPFLSRKVWLSRLKFFLLAIIGYAIAVVVVMFVSMMFTGIPD